MNARAGHVVRCSSCASRLDAQELVCPTCGEPTAPPERRLVTVMFADLTGYTELCSRLDPEEVHEFVRPAMTALRRLVESYGGSVPQVQGDGFMAVFGAPVAHEDDAERAVRAAQALIERVDALNADDSRIAIPGIHVGVNTGEAFVAASRELGGFSVAGGVINVGARLCGLARAGQVVVGDRTYELTRGIADYAAPRDRRVKGIDAPVRTAVLRSVRSVPAGPRPEPPRGPFVGRTAEIAALREELAAVVADRRSRLAVVRGEAGQGKSRLVAELLRAEPDATVLLGRCPAYGDPLPLTPLAEALASFAGTGRLETPARRSAALGALVTRLGLEGGLLAERLDAAVVGSTGESGAEALWADVAAFRLVLEALARSGPVILVLEDLQWAAASLQDLLVSVADGGWAGALFVVGTTRPEGVMAAGRVVELDVLAAEDMAALLRELAGGEPSALVQNELLARAGGNPLYLEECVRLLVEQGALTVRAHAVVSGPTAFDQIPQSMRMFIASRLDGVPADERVLLQDASVVGDVVWDSALLELHGAGATELLDRVAERGILLRTPTSQVPGATEYRFKHALLREVAYESMPRRARAERHRLVGDWFAQMAHQSGSPDSVLGVLAHHYERAWSLARSETTRTKPPCQLARLAVDHLLRWGRQQLDYQARTASTVLRRALLIAEAAPECLSQEMHAEVRIHLARGLTEQGALDEAGTLAEAGEAAARDATRADLTSLAVLVRAQALSEASRVDEARPLFAEAQAQAAATEDRRAEAEALHQGVLNERYSALLSHVPSLRRAYELYGESGDQVGQRRVAQRLAYWLTVEGGEEFQRWFDTASRHADDDQDLRSRAELARTRAFVEWYRGDHESALAAARQAASHAADAGARWVEADALTCQVAALAMTGRVDDAEVVLAQALDSSVFEGAVWFTGALGLQSARAAARSGRPEVADARIAATRAVDATFGERADQIDDADREGAPIRLERGDWAGAAHLAERSALACQEAGWRLYAIAPRLVHGRAALAAGRPDAEALLALAVELAHRHGAHGWGELGAACLEQAQLLAGAGAATRLRPVAGGSREVLAVEAENDAIRALRDAAYDLALDHLDEAVDAWASLGATVWLARALTWRAEVRSLNGSAVDQDRDHAVRVLSDLDSPLALADLALPTP